MKKNKYIMSALYIKSNKYVSRKTRKARKGGFCFTQKCRENKARRIQYKKDMNDIKRVVEEYKKNRNAGETDINGVFHPGTE